MKRWPAFLLAPALCLTVLLPARATTPAYTRLDHKVMMSDGVRLDASLYVPTAASPQPGGLFPLLVRQHGGGSHKDNDYDVGYGLKAVTSGRFALLMYSHRGHGDSEGIFDFFGERTTQDFSEMLDWVDAKTDVVDVGNVGTWGYSQGGGESLLPAEADERVKAVAVGNTFDDLNHALNPNDCFKFSFATGIFALAYKSAAARTDDATALRWGTAWYTDTEDVELPVFGSATADALHHSPLGHLEPEPGTTYDVGLNVPVFWANSWQDSLFPADHPDSIISHLDSKGIPTHLWFASGGHEVLGGDHLPDQQAKEHAMVEWFEEFLLGIDHGYASGARPRVDYAQRVPGGGWTHKTATDWPIPNAPAESYRLGDQVLVNTLVSANLASEPILTNRTGGTLTQLPEITPLEWQMSYVSSGPFEFTGAPHVDLRYIGTASRVAQLNVKIWDVDPSGNRTLVTRGCYSDQTPGDFSASFDLWPASHAFPAGNSMAVTVSTVDFPTFKPDTEPHTTTVSGSLTLPGVMRP